MFMLLPFKKRIIAWLRWSERYTKTDMVYFTSSGFWISVSQFVYVPLALGLSIAFANLVPKDVYGTYRFILSLASIISIFALTGIDAALPQAVARGYEGMLRRGFATYLRWSWMTISAAGLIATYYFLHGNHLIAYSILLAGACAPLFAGANLYSEFLSGRKEFRIGALCGALQVIFSTAVMLAVMLLTKGVFPLITAYFVSNMLGALALYAYVVWKLRPNDNVDPESVRFGYHVSITNVISTVADQLDRLMVFHLYGAAQLAEYSFAIAIPEYLRSSTKAVMILAIPKYAVRDRATAAGTVIMKVALFCVVLLTIILLYILAAPYIFSLIYPKYLAAIPYSQVYAFAILAGAGNIPVAVITAHRAVKEQYLQTVGNNLLRIVLLVVFSLVYGLWGIILARVIGRLLALATGTYLAQRMSAETSPEV